MSKIIFLLLINFISSSIAYAEASPKEEAIKCINLYNSSIKRYEALGPTEKFNFVHGFLKTYNDQKSVNEFMGKKEEFLANMEASDSYAKLLITLWAESCMENISISEK